MAELNVAVVSAERSLWSGTAKSIVAKTPEGEIGILPGHEPVLALLVESPLRIETTDGTKMLVAVHGGFFAQHPDDLGVVGQQRGRRERRIDAVERLLFVEMSFDSNDRIECLHDAVNIAMKHGSKRK